MTENLQELVALYIESVERVKALEARIEASKTLSRDLELGATREELVRSILENLVEFNEDGVKSWIRGKWPDSSELYGEEVI